VAEVVQADRLIRLAHCPPQILGLCTVRRDIVPVLSLNPGASGAELDPETPVVVLVLRSDQGMWGVRIDREGTAVSDGVLSASFQGEPTSGGAEVVGSVQRGDLAHAVIDPDRTWRNVRASVEAWYQR
jgi:purine-binding chemotaxis protein CheW